MRFFWKKMGCVGDVPLGSWHSVDGRNHTPSHSHLKKKDGTLKSPIEKDIFGVPAINFPECRYFVK